MEKSANGKSAQSPLLLTSTGFYLALRLANFSLNLGSLHCLDQLFKISNCLFSCLGISLPRRCRRQPGERRRIVALFKTAARYHFQQCRNGPHPGLLIPGQPRSDNHLVLVDWPSAETRWPDRSVGFDSKARPL